MEYIINKESQKRELEKSKKEKPQKLIQSNEKIKQLYGEKYQASKIDKRNQAFKGYMTHYKGPDKTNREKYYSKAIRRKMKG